jgi:hypothetical protein
MYQHFAQALMNLLLDCQHILSPNVQLAAQPALRTLVANGDPLPLSVFRAAEKQANKIHGNNHHNADDLSRSNDRGDNSNANRNRNADANRNENSNRNNQNQPGADSPLIYDRTAAGHPLASSRITVRKNPSNSNDTSRTAICFANAVKGRICRHGATHCGFSHYRVANDIPTDSKVPPMGRSHAPSHMGPRQRPNLRCALFTPDAYIITQNTH